MDARLLSYHLQFVATLNLGLFKPFIALTLTLIIVNVDERKWPLQETQN
jgi:hypothetical protein